MSPCQLEDDTNYEFYLEWLPLFCADLPYISEIKALWVIRIQNMLSYNMLKRTHARTHTHTHTRMCTCAGMHPKTRRLLVLCVVRSDKDVLMKQHDECGPLCRAKTKFEVEDIMTNMAHSRTHTNTRHDGNITTVICGHDLQS